MNEDTTCTRGSVLVKVCNAHICCKSRLVGFKTKETPNYTVSSQEKNWFLEEENGVMMGHGNLITITVFLEERDSCTDGCIL